VLVIGKGACVTIYYRLGQTFRIRRYRGIVLEDSNMIVSGYFETGFQRIKTSPYQLESKKQKQKKNLTGGRTQLRAYTKDSPHPPATKPQSRKKPPV